jgi:hypothetical protein
MSDTNGTYYLWKWADNNLPGAPNEVFSELLHGRLHPALQPFDARPMLRDLEATAATRQAYGEDWQWQVLPGNAPERAHFIFLQCPKLAAHGVFDPHFKRLVYPWGLSGYDEAAGDLIDCLLPKLNALVLKLDSTETHFDVTEDDLPVLLGRLKSKRFDSAYLVNAVGYWIECTPYSEGFIVEWRERRDRIEDAHADHWRAGRNQGWDARPKPRYRAERRFLGGQWREIRLKTFPQEKLRYADALRIFRAFLKGEPHPARYHWRDIEAELDQLEHALREERRTNTP